MTSHDPPVPRLLPEAERGATPHRPRRRAAGCTTPRAGATWTARAARSWPTWATACGRSRRRSAEQAGTARLRERHRVHPRSGRRSSPPRSPRCSPGDLDLVYPLCSGSEAVEAALKLARQYWVESGRAGQAEDHRALARPITATPCSRSPPPAREHYKTYFRDWLVEVVRVPAPYPYRCECHGRAAALPELQRRSGRGRARRGEGPDTVAALIAEPVGGSSTGASVPPPEYWRRVRAALRPLRGAAGRRRGADRRGPDRHLVGAGAVRGRAGHHDAGEGHRRRLRPALGGGGARGGWWTCWPHGSGALAACADVLPSCHALRRRRGHAAVSPASTR